MHFYYNQLKLSPSHGSNEWMNVTKDTPTLHFHYEAEIVQMVVSL